MQLEPTLFKGQLSCGTIGVSQPVITPDHCSFVEMDTVLYWVLWRQTLKQRTACRRFIEECSGGTLVRKAGRQDWAEGAADLQ